MKLDQDIRDLIEHHIELVHDGFGMRFTKVLDRKTYLKVDQFLQALGMTWNKKMKCHSIPTSTGVKDLATLQARLLSEEKVETPREAMQVKGQFDTPPALARRVAELAMIHEDDDVLEPSAGVGNLALAARHYLRYYEHAISCVEIDSKRVCELRIRGSWQVFEGDFLDINPHINPFGRKFDRILMNPPFAKQADIDHVMHAWEFLKPGGILVAIMSQSWTFRTNRKSELFQQLYYAYGTFLEENIDPEYQFDDTKTTTITVRLEKPL